MINLMRSADKNSFLCIKQVEKWLVKQMRKCRKAHKTDGKMAHKTDGKMPSGS